eukprot:TRINITY_DN20908_c0_g1_i1.p1 TRINITY_DN20908_c0_g1~~TRINITY_DN20908_c0_g1_i1.p1  ORF type:complete len:300 (+),score=137.93 TRINITY_DN20908_c0_g1_i1:56-955(+)
MLVPVITCLLVGTVGWLCLLSLRLPVLKPLGQYWFIAVTLVSLLNAWAVTTFATTFLPKDVAQFVACKAAKAAFTATVALNPQVTVTGDMDWEKMPQKSVLLMNHTSWLDSVIFCNCLPFGMIHNCRTLLKAALLALPIGGHIFKSAGHFPVHFAKDEDGSWSIDKEKQAPVTERLNAFMCRDGPALLSFYPEGVVNKKPEALQTFRRGSFQLPLDLDLPVWGFLMVGNDESWPAGGMPGGPGDIHVKLFPITEGKASLAAEDANAAALSELCHKQMQKELDGMLKARRAGGLASKKLD